MDGETGMTRATLEALIGQMLDAETRTLPPPVGEEGDAQASARSVAAVAPGPAETEVSATARKWVGLFDAGQWDAS